MKVLHITPSYYPAFKYGGPIQSVHLLNKALLQQGIEVDVLTSDAGIEGRVDTNTWVEVDGVRVEYCRYYGYEHYNFSPQLLWKALWRARLYDLIHITAVWNFPVLAGSLAGILWRKPYFISPRGTIYRETIELKSERIKKIYYSLIARHCLRHARRIHFTTVDERDKITEYLGLQTLPLVIPNGLDLSEFASLPPKQTFCDRYGIGEYILFLGRIHPKKGLDLLAGAFAKLYREYPALHLVIAGPDEEGYGEYIKKILGKAVAKTIFPGMLRGSEKFAAYSGATAFVLPSYSENFGMAAIEAMACEVPLVISNQVGIYKEVAENEAGIVVSPDVASVYQGIRELLDKRELARKYVVNARNLVFQYYRIEQVASAMAEVYRQVSLHQPPH